jgi:serine/threonine-protein kinase PpkA
MSINIPGYRIVRKINSGGMSTVYLAIQISVGRIVALKVMSPGLTSDPAFNERFQREATIVGQLSHPNIVSIYDIGREDDLNYIAMDYLPGGSLHDKMINGLTGAEVIRVTKDIANALDHAHEKGYIHRDIKPENILFRSDNSAVLSDFGVAKVMIGVSRMTHVGTVVGTPQYMSPEQARGQTVDARSDLYSLGVVFYEMLTGSLPFPGDDAVTIALKHISAPIPRLPLQYHAYQKILDKFLAKDSNQRFQRGREISEAFEHFDASIRASFNTSTASESLSVFALFRALCSATATQVMRRLKKVPAKMATHVQQEIDISEKVPQKNKRFFVWLFLGVFVVVASLLFIPTYTNNHTVALSPSSVSNMSTSNQQNLSDQQFILNQEAELQLAQVEPLTVSSQSASTAAAPVPEPATPAAEPIVPTFALTIHVTPKKSRIKLLNRADKYNEGMTLASGRYQIELSSSGYITQTEWIEIKNQAVEFNYQLIEDSRIEKPSTEEKSNARKPERPLASTAATEDTKNAPAFVRIAAGSFTMGDDENPLSLAARKVVIVKAFLIGRFEVTFDEYDLFVKATERAQPGDNGWGRETHPVMNVSWSDAQAYVQWLSKKSGKKYRLATEAEWEYVARAGTTTDFWWGDSDLDAKGRANCRRGCYSNYSGLFGSKTAPVGSYPANPFGIHDTAGNVAEWVQDCYKEPSDAAATSEQQECQTRVVRGGSTKNNAQDLASANRDHSPQDTYSEVIGFRVVMELP